jgi:hypothetical protein
MSGRRLDVSATQAVSSMLAALTGAVAASGLGIAGTLIGAAFMSLASTVGAAVYKHYLNRSNARLRAAAASLAPLASGNAVAAAVIRRHQARDPAEAADSTEDLAAADTTAVDKTAADKAAVEEAAVAEAPAEKTAREKDEFSWEDVTMAGFLNRSELGRLTSLHDGAGSSDATRAGHGTGPAEGLGSQDSAAASDSTGPLNGAASHEGAASHDGTAPLDGQGSQNGTGSHNGTGPMDGLSLADGNGLRGSIGDPAGADAPRPGGKRRWLLMAGAALSIFILAMGVVTAVEAIAGKPLESVIWHRSDSGSGTTLGGLVNSHPARHHQNQKPASSTSPTSSPSSTQPSATPSDTSPGPSPSPSSSATPGTTAPASSGTGSSTGSGTGSSTDSGTVSGTSPAPGAAAASTSRP